MRYTAAWAGYSFLQAKDAIMLMAKRTPEMLKGAIREKMAPAKGSVTQVRAI
jgi:hypothetical protein